MGSYFVKDKENKIDEVLPQIRKTKEQLKINKDELHELTIRKNIVNNEERARVWNRK